MENNTEAVEFDEDANPEYNRKSRLSFAVDSKIETEGGRIISIKDHSLKDEKFSKKVFYVVIGSDSSGKFQVSRRFSEFFLLRTVLAECWPGFYIPKVPAKQKIGTSDPVFIEKRKKLLELFLKKITNLDYIYLSKEFQSFLREQSDFKSVSKGFNISESKTSEIIITSFPRFIAEKAPEGIEEKYAENEVIFKSAIASLNEFCEQCHHCVENFDIFESDLITFMIELKEIGSVFTGKMLESGNRETFFNPYVILLDWATAEILDLEAIVEAIESKKKYLSYIQKLEEKLEKSRKNVLKIQSGKKSLSQIFSKKSKEDLSAKGMQEIEGIEAEIQKAKNCFNVMSLRLINKEIPMFKLAKFETYKHIMKVFATASIQELTILVQQIQAFEYYIEAN